jgi:hypothetical protein
MASSSILRSVTQALQYPIYSSSRAGGKAISMLSLSSLPRIRQSPLSYAPILVLEPARNRSAKPAGYSNCIRLVIPCLQSLQARQIPPFWAGPFHSNQVTGSCPC